MFNTQFKILMVCSWKMIPDYFSKLYRCVISSHMTRINND